MSNIDNSKNAVVDSHISVEGDLFIGDRYITNIYALPEFQKLKDEIAELKKKQSEAQIRVDRLKSIDDEGAKQTVKEDILQVDACSKEIEQLRNKLKEQRITLINTIKNAFEIDNQAFKQNVEKALTQNNLEELENLLDDFQIDKEILEKIGIMNRDANDILSKAASAALAAANLILTRREVNWYERANEKFEQAIEYKDDFNTNFQYAKFLYKHKELEKAKRYYEKLLTRGGVGLYSAESAKLSHNLGIIYQDLGENRLAIRSYEDAVRTQERLVEDSADDVARIKLAHYQSTIGTILANDKAIIAFESGLKQLDGLECTEALEQKADLYNNLATIYYGEDNYAQALEAYTEASSLYEGLIKEADKVDSLQLERYKKYNATILKNLASAQQQIGNYEAASKTYEKASHIFIELARILPHIYKIELGKVYLSLYSFCLC